MLASMPWPSSGIRPRLIQSKSLIGAFLSPVQISCVLVMVSLSQIEFTFVLAQLRALYRNDDLKVPWEMDKSREIFLAIFGNALTLLTQLVPAELLVP